MWFSDLFFFSSVFSVRQLLVEARPFTENDLWSTTKRHDVAENDALIELLAKDVPSPVPLKAFGTFTAHSLQEVIKDPSLIISNGTVPDYINNSSGGESELAAPEVKEHAATASCASPATRIEWRSYSASDRKAFVDAISCLTNLPSAGSAFSPSTSRYEDFVRIHQKMTPKVHGNGIFLLWHRYFVYTFEQALRTQCGFNRSLPWWDETKDSGKFHLSTLFTDAYFGSLPGPTKGSGTCVTNGRFANLICHIGPGSGNVNHCLSRAVDETLTSQSSTAYVNYCAQTSTTGAFSSCAETGPHAWAHNGIGSVMSDVYSSPSDPIFFMHHLFVDHELASWQQANSIRTQTVTSACLSGNSPCTDAVKLDTVLDMNGLRANAKVGDIINTQGGVLCYKYDYYS